jgi:hypothetical protein
MRDGETKTFRCKRESCDGRRRIELALLALLGEHMRDFAGRPGGRAVRPERELVDPAFLVVAGEHANSAGGIGRDEIAVVTASDDMLAVAGARQNAAGMDGDARFVFTREQQRFLAQHEHRRGAEEMHADDGCVRGDGPDAVGERGE